MDAELEAKLRELLAKQEIIELLYERARALDRHDLAWQMEAFTADATTTHQGWHGPMREFLTTRSGTAAGPNKAEIMDHFIGNVLVFLDDESHARAHSYHLCTYTVPGDAGGLSVDGIVTGRYFDWVVRTSEGWKITHRDTVFDWSATMPPGERMWAGSTGPHMLVGTSDETDPSFSRFKAQPG